MSEPGCKQEIHPPYCTWSWSSSNILKFRKESKEKCWGMLRRMPISIFDVGHSEKCTLQQVFWLASVSVKMIIMPGVLLVSSAVHYTSSWSCNLCPCVTQVNRNVPSLRWPFVHNTDEHCSLRKIAWWKLWVVCKFNENFKTRHSFFFQKKFRRHEFFGHSFPWN